MKCNIVRDLLPLYFEGLCSEETKRQLEEHTEHCTECRELMQSLKTEQEWPDQNPEWKKSIAPLNKIRKKVRRKNGLIILCVLLLLLSVTGTSLLAYGQITKRGISFEWICDSVRFRQIGKQFAEGDIGPLYEALSNGYRLQDAESGVVRLAYADKESYDEDMKEAIGEKYRQYFEGQELVYKGIEDIGYRESPGTGWNRALWIALKFQGKDGLEYYITLYKDLDGQYLADDFFGNSCMTYTSGVDPVPETEAKEAYHTEDSLFSCLPNRLKDFDLYMARHMAMSGGQRALQGDMTLIKTGQLRLNILYEQDLADGTDLLYKRINSGLDELAEAGYYLTDLTWAPREYDRTVRLYRYRIQMELTGKADSDKVVIASECYRISELFVYIPGTEEIYGENISPEIFRILDDLYE